MLSKIQAELKAPKGQRNDFGKYNYRSMEDINEAVKPILAHYNIAFVVTDEIIMLGSRFYIKATASLIREDGSVLASSTGYAREEETKKGMDASQITGSCSSYARKYAANGLFAIDDTKDADHSNKHGHNEKVPVKQDITPAITDEQLVKINEWKPRCFAAFSERDLVGLREWFSKHSDLIHKECGFVGKKVVTDYCTELTRKKAA